MCGDNEEPCPLLADKYYAYSLLGLRTFAITVADAFQPLHVAACRLTDTHRREYSVGMCITAI